MEINTFPERYLLLKQNVAKLPKKVVSRLRILVNLLKEEKISGETYVITTNGIVKIYLKDEYEDYLRSKNLPEFQIRKLLAS